MRFRASSCTRRCRVCGGLPGLSRAALKSSAVKAASARALQLRRWVAISGQRGVVQLRAEGGMLPTKVWRPP
jgi:hypothetical protein